MEYYVNVNLVYGACKSLIHNNRMEIILVEKNIACEM